MLDCIFGLSKFLCTLKYSKKVLTIIQWMKNANITNEIQETKITLMT